MTQYTISKIWNGVPLAPNEHIQVALEHDEHGHLDVLIDSPLFGDPPPEAEVGSTWQLWKSEVIEIFLVGPNGHYLEAEFGPYGHYLLLQLDGPRSILERDLSADYQAQITGDRWQGRARIDANLLPERIERLNLFAIHGAEPDRRYCAWSPLPGEQPDYHQPEHFPYYIEHAS